MMRTATALTTILALTSSLTLQPAFAASESELQFWRSAERAGQASDYRAYLDRYPEGDFAPLAKNRLREDQRGDDDAPAAARSPYQQEAALGLTAADRRDVQSRLVAAGYDTRGVDGVFGPGSRNAISGWQRAQDHEVTGYLTAEEYAALSDEARAEETSNAAESREWREARRADTERSYRTYLDRYPNGRHADEALTRIYGADDGNDGDDAEAKPTQAERRAERQERETALNYDAGQRAQVEQRLAIAGFDPGPVDGDFTRATRLAIASYRKDSGLEHGRYLDQEMVRRLVNDTNAASYTPKPGAATGPNGEINPNVAAAIAAGALAVGGALLLDDD